MMTVISCIRDQHDLMLVLAALLVGVAGGWTITRLASRVNSAQGVQKGGWLFMTSVASGAAIWCTHFVAMLGYDPGVPVGLDPVLTIVSLLIAIGGCAAGFGLATSGLGKFAPAFGGAVVGLTIAFMHYTGMIAYRVQGIVTWDMAHLIGSVAVATILCAVSLQIAAYRNWQADDHLSTSIFVLAVAGLHFTGMAAFQVEPMRIDGSFSDPQAMQALAMAIAGVAMLVVGAGLTSQLIDQSVRLETVERLRDAAMQDSLTGLPNRAGFRDRLDHEIDRASETEGELALINIDLDRFKEINDLRGHATGDEVLRVLAKRMQALLGPGEVIARLGGDEFAALHRIIDRPGLTAFLTRLETALFKPIRLDDYEVVPGASIGVAIYPVDGKDKETLLNNADLAMYRAKASLARAICFYEPSMDETVRARRSLTADLRHALESNALEVHYQVQTTVTTGEIRGYEALLRWKHPVHGYIPPAEFIPLAEQNGLILQIGEWVLRTACKEAATWDPSYKVAVNISPVQFVHAELPKLILEILVETGMPAQRLELELTESTIFVDKERSLRMLRQIKALGVSIALDDFGTGYSSLETLRAFPFDKIKLDRSFMSEVETSPQAKAIIRAVLALGKSLDIPVLAEGIETNGQLALLGSEGCDEAQGYLLGRPAPITDIIKSRPLKESSDIRAAQRNGSADHLRKLTA